MTIIYILLNELYLQLLSSALKSKRIHKELLDYLLTLRELLQFESPSPMTPRVLVSHFSASVRFCRKSKLRSGLGVSWLRASEGEQVHFNWSSWSG